MVFARKYRPKVLAELVGQQTVVRTLSNALTRSRLHHAYLFVGKFGCGKTSCSRILAASENCTVSPGLHPCGSCDLCRAVFAGAHRDVAEIDAASGAGKVEQIREIKNSSVYSPMAGAKTKYYIIDEAHRMSAPAEEALLKVLEEPPPKVRFVLCTTELQQMRGTIQSRCQLHEFKKIYWREIARHLETIVKAEDIKCDPEAVNVCARLSDGSMRNALQNLEKLIDFAGDSAITGEIAQEAFGTVDDLVFYDLVDEITRDGTPDATRAFKIINELLAVGVSANQIFEGITDCLRNILVGCSSSACADLIIISDKAKNRLREQMKNCQPKMQSLVNTIKGLVEARTAVEYGQPLDAALQMWFLESVMTFKGG